MKHILEISKQSINSEPMTEPSRIRRRRSRADRHIAQHLLLVLRTGGDARAVKVKRVRQSVRSRTYENDLKVAVAVDRMVGDIRGD